MKRIDPQLARFGAQTAAFVCQVLGAEWGCFYQIDAQGQPYGFQAHGAPDALRNAYRQHNIGEIDPLHPACLADTDLRYVPVHDPRLQCSSEHRRGYWNFLCAFGSRDCAEMIFRVGGRATAGLSLIWTSRAGVERDRGEAVHAYVEYNLASQLRPMGSDQMDICGAPNHLTTREREIIELVCQGSTNLQIAQHLDVGVATVKTHLIHVFKKCGVKTRTALVRQILSPLPESNC